MTRWLRKYALRRLLVEKKGPSQFSSLPSRWLTLAVLVVSGLLIVGVRARLFDFPLERDEGEYGYMGQLILEGVPPYELAGNMKMPGIYLAYATIMTAVFGQTAMGIHLGLLLVHLATLVVLVFCGAHNPGLIRSGDGHNGLWDDDFKSILSWPGRACDAICGAADIGGNANSTKKRRGAFRLFCGWFSFWHRIPDEANRRHFWLLGRVIFNLGRYSGTHGLAPNFCARGPELRRLSHSFSWRRLPLVENRRGFPCSFGFGRLRIYGSMPRLPSVSGMAFETPAEPLEEYSSPVPCYISWQVSGWVACVSGVWNGTSGFSRRKLLCVLCVCRMPGFLLSEALFHRSGARHCNAGRSGGIVGFPPPGGGIFNGRG